jgi:hypothetical protein
MENSDQELFYVYRDHSGNIMIYASSIISHLPIPTERVYRPKTSAMVPLTDTKIYNIDSDTGVFK